MRHPWSPFPSWLLIAAALALSPGHPCAADWGRLTTPPTDTAEARRLRLWLPLEKPSRCRTTIDIYDSERRAVRRMVDQLMASGYYNFYWDKRDDSGRFVEPGAYRWRAISCSGTIMGELTVQYHQWERSARLAVIDSIGSARFELQLDNDSARVTAIIQNHRGRHLADLVADTLLNQGRHYFHWDPPSGYAGRFQIVATVGGFQLSQDFLYRRSTR